MSDRTQRGENSWPEPQLDQADKRDTKQDIVKGGHSLVVGGKLGYQQTGHMLVKQAMKHSYVTPA